MDQPRCKTCPFWDTRDFRLEWKPGDDDLKIPQLLKKCLDEWDRTVVGECRRYPRMNADAGEGTGEWPRTADFDWCGEHPDFPAFLARKKTKGDPCSDVS